MPGTRLLPPSSTRRAPSPNGCEQAPARVRHGALHVPVRRQAAQQRPDAVEEWHARRRHVRDVHVVEAGGELRPEGAVRLLLQVVVEARRRRVAAPDVVLVKVDCRTPFLLENLP